MATPTDITISGNVVLQGTPINTAIATISATSSDPLDVFAYELSNDADGRFEIIGDELLVANQEMIDYTGLRYLPITIVAHSTLTADSFGKSFTIVIVENMALACNITEISPLASTEFSKQRVIVQGNNFAIGGIPTATINGQPIDLISYNNTALDFAMPSLTMGYYTLTVHNGNGN